MFHYLIALIAILYARAKYGVGYAAGFVSGLVYFYGREPFLVLTYPIRNFPRLWNSFWRIFFWPASALFKWQDRHDTFGEALLVACTMVVLYVLVPITGLAAWAGHYDAKNHAAYVAYLDSLVGKTVVDSGYSPVLERWYVVVEDTPNHTQQIQVDYHTAIEAVIGRPYHKAHK